MTCILSDCRGIFLGCMANKFPSLCPPQEAEARGVREAMLFIPSIQMIQTSITLSRIVDL